MQWGYNYRDDFEENVTSYDEDYFRCRDDVKENVPHNNKRYHYKSKGSSQSRVKKLKKQPPQPVKIIPYLFCENVQMLDNDFVYFEDIHSYNHEFDKISSLITNECFRIDLIQKIHNPFLESAYNLKKEQKCWEFPDFQEKLLFHGTPWENLDNICRFNFNWRLCGINVGHRYGQGVSFSSNATYASNYSDLNVHKKVMVVAKVLIGKSCNGYEDMVLPPPGYDTTVKESHEVVVVKYDDGEFYPAYKLVYHFENPFKRRNPSWRWNHVGPRRDYYDPYFYRDYYV